MAGKVRVIPANTNEPIKHVVIYARVSSNTMEQLECLKVQVSGLTKFVSAHRILISHKCNQLHKVLE